MGGLFQTYTVALDGLHHLLDGRILSNDRSFQFLFEVLQTNAFRLLHALYGNTRHHRYNLGHLFFCDHLPFLVVTIRPFILQGLHVML